jgi:hypothetical protein
MSVDLEHHGRVAQPGHPQPRWGWRCEAARLDQSGARTRLGRHVGVGLEERNHRGPQVVYQRLRVLEVGAVPLGRLSNPLAPGTSGPAAKGGAARSGARGGHYHRRQPRCDQPPASPSRHLLPRVHIHHKMRITTGNAPRSSRRREGAPQTTTHRRSLRTCRRSGARRSSSVAFHRRW